MRLARVLIPIIVVSIVGHGLAQVMSVRARNEAIQAVVQIWALDWEEDQLLGTGSGTIISSNGFILTNAHVITGPDGNALELLPIFTTSASRPMDAVELTYFAVPIDVDVDLDLALLQVLFDSSGEQLPAEHSFSHAPIGTVEGMQLGDSVFVVGYPGVSGDTVTFTSGVVSGFLGADLRGSGNAWVKTDARIAPGNSGGGAFDETGTLVGVPTALIARSGPGEIQELFRPINYAYGIIERNVPLTLVQLGPRIAEPSTGTGQGTDNSLPGAGSVTIRQGVHVEGSLDLLDAHYFPDRLAHSFALKLSSAGELDVTLESSDFDPYIALLGPNGDIVEEVDDSPGRQFGISERLRVKGPGTYTLIVTTAFPGESGAYALGVSPGDGVGGVEVSRSQVPVGPATGKTATYTGYWSGYLLDTQGGRGAVVADLVQTGSSSVEGRWESTFSWGVTSGILVGLIQSDGLFLELYPDDRTACPFSGLAELSGFTIAGAYTAFDCSVPIAGSVSLTKRIDR